MDMSLAEYGNLLSDFFKDIGFKIPPYEVDRDVREAVINYFDSQPWPHLHHQSAVRSVKHLWNFSMTFSLRTSIETRARFVILIIYASFLDSASKYFGGAMDDFMKNIILYQPQDHPVLQSFVEFLFDNQEYMGPCAYITLTESMIGYMKGCMIDRETSLSSFSARAQKAALGNKSPFAEVYAHLIYPQELFPEKKYLHLYLPVIPEISYLITSINDLLSLHRYSKTAHRDEIANNSVAIANNMTPLEALKVNSKEIAQCIRHIRDSLSDCPELLEATNTFIDGYISWHLHSDLYGLDDIPIFDKDDIELSQCVSDDKVLRNPY